MPMHARLAVRLVGQPFSVKAPKVRPKNTVGEMLISQPPRFTVMQTIEYITARTVVTVPVSEIYDPREPDELIAAYERRLAVAAR